MTTTLDQAGLSALLGAGGPIHSWLEQHARRVETMAQQINPTNTRTGAYRSGFFHESRGGGTDWSWVVGNKAPHAGFIESGTRPHVIRPKRAKVLVFFSEAGTPIGVVHARQVNHPGTPAFHVLERALQSTPYRQA